MALTLCALLWARPGEERALIAYEDAVLQLVAVHGGHVVQRARTDGVGDAPLEIHLLQFPSEAALEAYMDDPNRLELQADRDRAIARTELHRVDLM
jgi:uncharacterized protein (DUF1330 family)